MKLGPPYVEESVEEGGLGGDGVGEKGRMWGEVWFKCKIKLK